MGYSAIVTDGPGFFLRRCPQNAACYNISRCTGTVLDTDLASVSDSWFGDRLCRTFRDGCNVNSADSTTIESARSFCVELRSCAGGTESPSTRPTSAPSSSRPTPSPTSLSPTASPLSAQPTASPTSASPTSAPTREIIIIIDDPVDDRRNNAVVVALIFEVNFDAIESPAEFIEELIRVLETQGVSRSQIAKVTINRGSVLVFIEMVNAESATEVRNLASSGNVTVNVGGAPASAAVLAADTGSSSGGSGSGGGSSMIIIIVVVVGGVLIFGVVLILIVRNRRSAPKVAFNERFPTQPRGPKHSSPNPVFETVPTLSTMSSGPSHMNFRDDVAQPAYYATIGESNGAPSFSPTLIQRADYRNVTTDPAVGPGNVYVTPLESQHSAMSMYQVPIQDVSGPQYEVARGMHNEEPQYDTATARRRRDSFPEVNVVEGSTLDRRVAETSFLGEDGC